MPRASRIRGIYLHPTLTRAALEIAAAEELAAVQELTAAQQLAAASPHSQPQEDDSATYPYVLEEGKWTNSEASMVYIFVEYWKPAASRIYTEPDKISKEDWYFLHTTFRERFRPLKKLVESVTARAAVLNDEELNAEAVV